MTSAAAVALNMPSWQRLMQSGKATTLSMLENEALLFLPLHPCYSSCASDSHTKCNLQHYLHLFTFTNYIPLKLPRKICQKNVITQCWNLASSEISSLPFCKKALWDLTEPRASSGSWGPSQDPEGLPEACLGLSMCR